MVKVLETFQKLLDADSLSSSGVSEQDALEIFKWLNANFGLMTRINQKRKKKQLQSRTEKKEKTIVHSLVKGGPRCFLTLF